jgi:hypothetical protein
MRVEIIPAQGHFLIQLIGHYLNNLHSKCLTGQFFAGINSKVCNK